MMDVLTVHNKITLTLSKYNKYLRTNKECFFSSLQRFNVMEHNFF